MCTTLHILFVSNHHILSTCWFPEWNTSGVKYFWALVITRTGCTCHTIQLVAFFRLHLHATWQQLYNYFELQQDFNSGIKKAVILALYPDLLTPAFDACGTNTGESLVKLITCNGYLDIRWMCGGVPHSKNNCKYAIDRKHRPWTQGWPSAWHQAVLATFLGFRKLLHSCTEGICHSSTCSPNMHVISFTIPVPALVLQAINTGVKSPGYEAAIILRRIIPLCTCLYTGHKSSYNSDDTYKDLGFTTTLSCPE